MKGEWKTRRVWIDGNELLPGRSQKIVNHSPDGFNWGYGGSGPAQLALAILLSFLPEEKAILNYQNFKWDLIATLPQSDFEIVFNLEKYKGEKMKKEEYERRMVFARQEAAKAWCGEKTKDKTMDADLAEELAKILIDHMYAPHLGCATTGEIIEELKARSNLEYKTVGYE